MGNAELTGRFARKQKPGQPGTNLNQPTGD